jgi:hypothetical protein
MDELIERIEKLELQIYDLILDKYFKDLKENGYVIIPNILSTEEIDLARKMFFDWKNQIEDLDKFHNMIDPHGIFKFHEVGHQEFAWFIRTRPKIINLFKKLWDTNDLVVSFDGSCYIPKNCEKSDKIWTHTDQAPNSTGLKCYQSLVALSSNEERTLVVYEKSHLIHEKYFKDRNIKSSNNWHLIDHKYLEEIKCYKRELKINKGDLVIWDSRTFHQNKYGKPNSEERLVQYVCYLPKNDTKNNQNQRAKREKYFLERRTTSHWPYSLKVNSLQPQTYGNTDRLIDYSKLKPPDLSKYMDTIKTLI